MARKSQAPQDEGMKTPAWIVSFSDMVTLLLAFFVMLQAFAKVRDPAMMHAGRGSFRMAVAGLGIPNLLFGEEETYVGKTRKKKHPTEESDEATRDRVIDAEDERIRQVFAELKRLADTQTTDLANRARNVLITPVRFGHSKVSLDASAKEYLDALAIDINENADKDSIRVYVVGLAPDQPVGKAQWLVSARRARVVEEYLRKALRPLVQADVCEVISWGAPDHWYGASKAEPVKGAGFIRITIETGN